MLRSPDTWNEETNQFRKRLNFESIFFREKKVIGGKWGRGGGASKTELKTVKRLLNAPIFSKLDV